VAHLGWPPSPLVRPPAQSVIALPPNKRTVAQGGGCHLTAASPIMIEWSSLLDRAEGSSATVWSWLKWGETSRCVSLGKGGQPSPPR
jgi:hypothetical protein